MFLLQRGVVQQKEHENWSRVGDVGSNPAHSERLDEPSHQLCIHSVLDAHLLKNTHFFYHEYKTILSIKLNLYGSIAMYYRYLSFVLTALQQSWFHLHYCWRHWYRKVYLKYNLVVHTSFHKEWQVQYKCSTQL